MLLWQAKLWSWLHRSPLSLQRWALMRARKGEKVQPELIHCRQNQVKEIRYNKVLWGRVWEQMGWEDLTGRMEMGEAWKGTKLCLGGHKVWHNCIATGRVSRGIQRRKLRKQPWAEKRDGRTGYTGQSQGEADGAIQLLSLRAMACQEFWRVRRMEWILK